MTYPIPSLQHSFTSFHGTRADMAGSFMHLVATYAWKRRSSHGSAAVLRLMEGGKDGKAEFGWRCCRSRAESCMSRGTASGMTWYVQPPAGSLERWELGECGEEQEAEMRALCDAKSEGLRSDRKRVPYLGMRVCVCAV